MVGEGPGCLEEEKSRSGVKSQRRREGMDVGVGIQDGSCSSIAASCAGVSWVKDAAGTVDFGGRGGWMRNLRMPVFSMRCRRRAEIHFSVEKEVGVGAELS